MLYIIILLVLTLINYNNMIVQTIFTLLFIMAWPFFFGWLFYKDNQYTKKSIQQYKQQKNIK